MKLTKKKLKDKQVMEPGNQLGFFVEYNSIEKVKNVLEEWYLVDFQINLACFV